MILVLAGPTYGKSCRDVILSIPKDGLRLALQDPTEFESIRTVHYLGQVDGYSALLKPDRFASWSSHYNPIASGFNKQGDVRSPLFVFGHELASKMEFRIRLNPDGSKTMYVPGSSRLSKTVKSFNSVLRSDGLEPISYLPVGFGYANEAQMLKLSISGGKEFEMLFPFADRDPQLTAHEVSFHIGSLLLSRKILSRTRVVTERNLEMIELIENMGDALGPAKTDIINQIKKDRAIELDFGTANFVAVMTNFRKNHSNLPYKTILQEDPTFADKTEAEISILTRSSLSPSMSVVQRLIVMLDMQFEATQIGIKFRSVIFKPKVTAMGHGRQLRISDRQKEKMLEMMKTFLDTHKQTDSQFEITNGSEMSRELLENMDTRIQQLSSAANRANR